MGLGRWLGGLMVVATVPVPLIPAVSISAVVAGNAA